MKLTLSPQQGRLASYPKHRYSFYYTSCKQEVTIIVPTTTAAMALVMPGVRRRIVGYCTFFAIVVRVLSCHGVELQERVSAARIAGDLNNTQYSIYSPINVRDQRVLYK